MTASQPKTTPDRNSTESLIYGIYDRLVDHGRAIVNIVLAPADADGKPDWENAYPVNLESLPADEWPEDPIQAARAAVLVDDLDGCDPATSMLVFLREDGSPSIQQIAGPDADADIAMRMIGRDIGARPPERPPTPLAESLAKLTAELFPPKPVAANDNAPPALAELQRLHGGTISGGILRGAQIDGVGRNIKLVDGEPWLLTRGDEPFSKLPVVAPTPALEFINPTIWHGQPLPVREWYCEDLIPMRQVTILNGDGGVGKSLLALQIAAAGALGVDTIGIAPLPGRAVYIGAEDEATEFQRRLADIVRASSKDFDELGDFRLLSLADCDALISVPDRAGNMQATALFAKIIAFLCEFRPRLVVLDTAADLFGGDEIKRGQVRQFISELRKIAIGLDCAVILLAHPSVDGMRSGTGSSGSTAWNNSVRSRLYLTRPEGKDEDPDLRALKTMKANYGATGGVLKFKWRSGVFVLDDGKPTPGSMLMAARAERIFLELLSDVNRSGLRVSAARSVTYAPTVMKDMEGADGVSRKDLETAMRRLLKSGDIKVVMEGSPSKQRQRLIVSAEDFGPSNHPTD